MNTGALSKDLLDEDDALKLLGVTRDVFRNNLQAAEAMFIGRFNKGAPRTNNENCYEVNRQSGPDGRKFIVGGSDETIDVEDSSKAAGRMKQSSTGKKVTA